MYTYIKMFSLRIHVGLSVAIVAEKIISHLNRLFDFFWNNWHCHSHELTYMNIHIYKYKVELTGLLLAPKWRVISYLFRTKNRTKTHFKMDKQMSLVTALLTSQQLFSANLADISVDGIYWFAKRCAHKYIQSHIDSI